MNPNEAKNMKENRIENQNESRIENQNESQIENQNEIQIENQNEIQIANRKEIQIENRKEHKETAGMAGPAGFVTILLRGLVLLECLILAVGIGTSFFSTLKVTKLSGKYAPFFLLVLLGVGMIAVLIRFFRKKWAPLLGILLILIYLFTAGYGYFICELNAGRLKRLAFYQGKEVVLTIDGEQYVWNGQAKYGSKDLVLMSDNRMASIRIGDETKNIALSSLSVRNGEEDRIYYQIYGGATGDYLVFEKSPEG